MTSPIQRANWWVICPTMIETPDVYTAEDGAKRGSSFSMSGSICNYARAECVHAPKHVYQSAHLLFSGHEFVCRHSHLEMTNTR